jgi:hypothetical protein
VELHKINETRVRRRVAIEDVRKSLDGAPASEISIHLLNFELLFQQTGLSKDRIYEYGNVVTYSAACFRVGVRLARRIRPMVIGQETPHGVPRIAINFMSPRW